MNNKIAIIVIFEVTVIIIMFWFPTIYRPNIDSIEYIEPEKNGNDDVVDDVIEPEEYGNDDVVDDVIEP